MSSDKNSVLISGNLVKDPQLKELATSAVCNFTIASNKWIKKGEVFDKDVLFIDISAWGDLAYNASSNIKKGDCVEVVGRLKQEKWQGQDGIQKSRLVIVAESIRPIQRERNDNSHSNRQPDYVNDKGSRPF